MDTQRQQQVLRSHASGAIAAKLQGAPQSQVYRSSSQDLTAKGGLKGLQHASTDPAALSSSARAPIKRNSFSGSSLGTAAGAGATYSTSTSSKGTRPAGQTLSSYSSFTSHQSKPATHSSYSSHSSVKSSTASSPILGGFVTAQQHSTISTRQYPSADPGSAYDAAGAARALGRPASPGSTRSTLLGTTTSSSTAAGHGLMRQGSGRATAAATAAAAAYSSPYALQDYNAMGPIATQVAATLQGSSSNSNSLLYASSSLPTGAIESTLTGKRGLSAEVVTTPSSSSGWLRRQGSGSLSHQTGSATTANPAGLPLSRPGGPVRSTSISNKQGLQSAGSGQWQQQAALSAGDGQHETRVAATAGVRQDNPAAAAGTLAATAAAAAARLKAAQAPAAVAAAAAGSAGGGGPTVSRSSSRRRLRVSEQDVERIAAGTAQLLRRESQRSTDGEAAGHPPPPGPSRPNSSSSSQHAPNTRGRAEGAPETTAAAAASGHAAAAAAAGVPGADAAAGRGSWLGQWGTGVAATDGSSGAGGVGVAQGSSQAGASQHRRSSSWFAGCTQPTTLSDDEGAGSGGDAGGRDPPHKIHTNSSSSSSSRVKGSSSSAAEPQEALNPRQQQQPQPAKQAPGAVKAAAAAAMGTTPSAASSTSSGRSASSPKLERSPRQVSFTKLAAAAVGGAGTPGTAAGTPAAAAAAAVAALAVPAPAGAAAAAAGGKSSPVARTGSPISSMFPVFSRLMGKSGSPDAKAAAASPSTPGALSRPEGKPAAAAGGGAAAKSSSKVPGKASSTPSSTTTSSSSSSSSKAGNSKGLAKPGSAVRVTKQPSSTSRTPSSSTLAAAAAPGKLAHKQESPAVAAAAALQQQRQQQQEEILLQQQQQQVHLQRMEGSSGSCSSFYSARGSLPGSSTSGAAGDGSSGGAACSRLGLYPVATGSREGSDPGLYCTGSSSSPPGSPFAPVWQTMGPDWVADDEQDGRRQVTAARMESFRISTAMEVEEETPGPRAASGGWPRAGSGRNLSRLGTGVGDAAAGATEDSLAARQRLLAGGSSCNSSYDQLPVHGRRAPSIAAASRGSCSSSDSDISPMAVSDDSRSGRGSRRAAYSRASSSSSGGEGSSSSSEVQEEVGSWKQSGSMPASTAATAARRSPLKAVASPLSSFGRRGTTRPEGCVGLVNLGNTCFMNSILQCLNCVPEFVKVMRDHGKVVWHSGSGRRSSTEDSSSSSGGSSSSSSSPMWRSGRTQQQLLLQQKGVGPAYASLVQEMWGVGSSPASGSAPYVRPARLLRELASKDDRWGEGCQQDSQEFLISLLEMLQMECNRVRGKPLYRELSGRGTETQQAEAAAAYAKSWHDSVIDDIFGGQLQSTLTCNTCGWQSHCFDPCFGVNVPIPKTKPVSVEDCLAAFVEQETLGGSEQVKCGGSCGSLQPATKKLQIYQAPKVLVLTLKRFSSSGGYGCFHPFSKNSTPVNISEVLDLTPFCNPRAKSRFALWGDNKRYKLVAMSHHSGCMGGGHYTAEGRAKDSTWWEFNDECVDQQGGPPVGASSSAYVLFYRQDG